MAFHSNYGLVLYHFRDKARHWSKIAIFFIPPAFDAPLGGLSLNIAIWFGTEKLEWCGYPNVKKVYEKMLTRFDRIHERDRHPDRQTDRQTPHDGISRAYA